MKITFKPLKSLFVLFFLVSTAAFSQNEVSDTELQNFANAFTSIQEVNQRAQSEMMQVIQSADMDLNRFNQIYEASLNPSQTGTVDMTEEETKKFQTVMSKMETMQPVFQKEMEDAVVKQGMTIERFEQVAATIETDSSLQQRFQAMMMQ